MITIKKLIYIDLDSVVADFVFALHDHALRQKTPFFICNYINELTMGKNIKEKLIQRKVI